MLKARHACGERASLLIVPERLIGQAADGGEAAQLDGAAGGRSPALSAKKNGREPTQGRGGSNWVLANDFLRLADVSRSFSALKSVLGLSKRA